MGTQDPSQAATQLSLALESVAETMELEGDSLRWCGTPTHPEGWNFDEINRLARSVGLIDPDRFVIEPLESDDPGFPQHPRRAIRIHRPDRPPREFTTFAMPLGSHHPNPRQRAWACDVMREWAHRASDLSVVSKKVPLPKVAGVAEGLAALERTATNTTGDTKETGQAPAAIRKPLGWTRSELLDEANKDDHLLGATTFDSIRKAAGVLPGKPGGAGAHRRYSIRELRQMIEVLERSGTKFRNASDTAEAWHALIPTPE